MLNYFLFIVPNKKDSLESDQEGSHKGVTKELKNCDYP